MSILFLNTNSYQRKKESQSTNFTVFDLEKHNTARARHYCISICRLKN